MNTKHTAPRPSPERETDREAELSVAIDDYVPLPNRTGGPGRRKWPFDKLAVGQSFFAPGKLSMGSTYMVAKARTGFEFTQSRVVENGVSGVRVWRTA